MQTHHRRQQITNNCPSESLIFLWLILFCWKVCVAVKLVKGSHTLEVVWFFFQLSSMSKKENEKKKMKCLFSETEDLNGVFSELQL